MIRYLKVFVFLKFIVNLNAKDGDFVNIDTKLGNLKGFRHQIGEELEADVFLGVPYAIPPLGDLRFEVDKKKLSRSSLEFLKQLC